MMIAALRSEWIKHRRGLPVLLALLLPSLLAGVLAWYQGHRPADWTSYLSLALTAWGGLVIPAGAGLITALLAQPEQQPGGWGALRTRPLAPGRLLLAKWLLGALLTGVATLLFLAFTLVAGVWWLDLPGGAPVLVTALGGLFMVGTALPLLAVHLWLAVGYGFGPAMGLGGVSLFLALLLGTTSMGDGVWSFVPFTWPVRTAPAGLYYLVGLAPPVQTWSVLLGALALTGLTLVGCLLWFARWEGQAFEV